MRGRNPRLLVGLPYLSETSMPWNPKDARRHTRKADTPKKQRQWMHVANSMLSRGKSEGSAVRAANAAVKRNGTRRRRKKGRR